MTAIPILFTVNGSSRHELMLVSPENATLSGIQSEMISLSASSPNCAEFMGKYNKSASAEQEVQEMIVKWNAQTHDPKIFPASTVVTEENFKAVVSMIGASGVGRDVFEIKIGAAGGKE